MFFGDFLHKIEYMWNLSFIFVIRSENKLDSVNIILMEMLYMKAMKIALSV